MTDHPSIDHTILSPSGRVSKRAREAALKREHDRLFPTGYWDRPEPTEAEKAAAQRKNLLRRAATLRELAERGMSPRKYTRAADRLEAEARTL